jgi:hypothetical protein
MGMTTSKEESVKYGDKCYETEPNDFTFHRMYAYTGAAFLLLSGGLFAATEMKAVAFALLVLAMILFGMYFFVVYKRHTKIKNSSVIECKDSFRTYSIW